MSPDCTIGSLRSIKDEAGDSRPLRPWHPVGANQDELFTLSVGRGQWVLMSATKSARGVVRLHSSQVDAHRQLVWTTRRLLVYSHVPMAVLSSRPFELRDVDMLALTKLLAFHDDARGISLHGNAAQTCSITEATHLALEDRGEATRWMVSGFTRVCATRSQVYGVLRRTEAYRLVRFLLAQEPSIKASRLSERYGLSPTHFRRKCRQVLGQSLKGQLRLLRAARSLLEYGLGNEPFTTVAADHGYSSAAHFSSEVRSLFGKSPTELYRSCVNWKEAK
ncbi:MULTISPECIES: helix-turn-helix domain-containing protein [Dyella]|uniref:Helix-turn-helix domain-containing protein n=2 Tax=Dyella TaxID=231454 RepID=A0A4V2NML0_9GAMM|nr:MULTISPECIES: helix-turn-helix domain-containing protein [Dyella]TBR38722.1 helix-turn-helix domain-containing protein [Dyella terrae]TCI13687.1 helix-turn-helix domain-containing protein [Dyella soli]